MNSIDFAELSREQADEWRRFVEHRGPAALAEMATWMAEDGGPLDEADGTWNSLLPVWSWVVDFARRGGAETLGEPLRASSQAQAFGLSSTSPVPSAALGEDLEHYVYYVLKRYDSDTQWSVFASPLDQRVVDADHQVTGIASGGGWVSLWSNLPTMIRQAVKGHIVGRPDGLQVHLLNKLVLPAAPSSGPGPSILRSRVKTAPWSPSIPDFSSVSVAVRRLERFGTVSGILSSGATKDDLSAGRGLRTEAVLNFLEPFGLELTGGGQETSDTIAQSGLRGTLFSSGILLETYGKHGILSSLVFEPTVVSRAEWESFSSAAAAFAREHGAQFVALEQ